jgi:predicted transcriptional regulator
MVKTFLYESAAGFGLMATFSNRKIATLYPNNQLQRHHHHANKVREPKRRDDGGDAVPNPPKPIAVTDNVSVKGRTNSIMGTVTQQLELLNRHFHVLELLVNNKKPLGILKLSKLVGCPAHQIRYSLRELETGGLVVPTTQGAKIGGNLATFTETAESDLKTVNKHLDELGLRIAELKKRTGSRSLSSDDEFRPGNLY